jgi:serine/threonine-protein kinase
MTVEQDATDSAAGKPPCLQNPRYELIEVAGRGGIATVWRALDRDDNAAVAIKVMDSAAVDLQAVQRLAQEVEILSKLHHPCIIRVLATGVTEDERPYVVMEWANSITLRDHLEESPKLPPADVVDIINQICSALTEAHAHNVIHRDLKPENILLLAPEHLLVKVVDFGMAKLLDEAAPDLSLSNETTICGTPQYMSPERARALPATAAADVYAVGVMAYEMLTGRRPFDGSSPIRVLVQQTHDDVPPMPEVSDALADVVLAALAKDPDNRPRAAEFAHMLEHTVGG